MLVSKANHRDLGAGTNDKYREKRRGDNGQETETKPIETFIE